jgi:biopolymer transport protein ExbD
MSDTNWLVRFEGANIVRQVPTATAVLEGIQEGEWEPHDEVKGPADTAWRPIEEHPQFADAVAEMGEKPRIEVDDSHLDMNPLIDVALVLLIFFILTTTYASLRRTIDVPASSDEAKQQQRPPDDMLNKAFRVTAWQEAGKPTLKIEEEIVPFQDMEKHMTQMVRTTGKTEIVLEVDGRLPWGTEASIHDAAKAANVSQIYRKAYKGQQ